ncbi:acyl-CoA carboxylase subunit beta [Clostridium sp. C105KSO13]|uniref:acyl-CoA carboxylase subunit beta n=1 Tax=Clostridium sp. C105KSO13 TaxID=1776045 RepID=UPI0007405B99|nr:carboxyl transferase domain-containing protein [Clostridium sp. C105KSO13]CUX19262.1 putative propionyl-CoA carboxylase beta chain 5 [Clostridium sp. C105KSO13]
MDNSEKTKAIRRIESLLDAGSFIEIGKEITARATDFNLKEVETPGDGVITGYGVIDQNLVYVYSQDAAVLGGAVGEMHAKKVIAIYDMAMKMGAPVIALLDSAGLRLQEATDALEAFGSIFKKQTMACGVVPQISAVFGSCGGGLAVSSDLADFTFMETQAKLFINSPNAIAGNEKSKCDTSSAEFRAGESGVVDYVGSEEEITAKIRQLVSILPGNNKDGGSYCESEDDLNRLIPDISRTYEDTAIVLTQLSDGGQFIETKKDFAKDMVTGFIKLNGYTVGAVANRSKIYNAQAETETISDGSLSGQAARKAADFIRFCDAFSIPILTLTNVSGFTATRDDEINLTREAARLVYAFAEAEVAKVNVIIGKAYGTSYQIMNSKSLGADMVYAWPDAQIGMMEAEKAAKVIYAEADMQTIKEKTAEYQKLQTSPLSAARRGYIDAIIAPEETRKYLIGAFEMLYTKREDRPAKKHGTV